MHDFAFKNNELYCEQIPVRRIAERVGTPAYIYSHKTLTDHFVKIQKAFAQINPLICFAMKSNENLAVLRTMVNAGAGFDIVSVGELKKALKAGADPKKIVFASVGKTDEEIEFAIKKKILLFNVESLPELENINRIASNLSKKVHIALRINPNVEAVTHKAVVTGTLKNKFGIDIATAKKIFLSQESYSNVLIDGIHIHIGSQITEKAPFVKAISKMLDLIAYLRAQKVALKYLDIGGGLGIIYNNERPQTAKNFADAVITLLEKSNLQIIMEPGRFISGNAGIFITKVLYLKDNGVKKFLIVDGGMNDLIRPSLYSAYHEIIPVKQVKSKKSKMDVVGPICESGDFLGKDRLLPNLKKNDLLAVMSAGAYGYVMSSNYNVRTKVPEVIVRGNEFAITKKRETFTDLLRGESIPDFIK